jgi:regulator of sirC expression with transglutaminase-like and TPR domain
MTGPARKSRSARLPSAKPPRAASPASDAQSREIGHRLPRARIISPAPRCFAIAHRPKKNSASRVETETLSDAQREALLGLLDDPSPAVRRALLAHFAALGAPAAAFLQAVIRGPNRLLARHAAAFFDELKFADPIAEFRGFIRSLNYELESGSILLARTVAPRLDVGECCATLDAIAARCRELIAEPSSSREKCRVMNRVLFHEWGFHGNVEHYTDPRNSFLDQVLARRTGIPLSLSIVYLLVAGRLGLELEAVGLPSHFLVGCFTDELPFFIDPYENGLFRDTDEVLELLRASDLTPKPSDLMPTPVREILCGNCRNLVNHYTTAGEPERARLFASFVEEFEVTHARHAQS